MSMYIGNLTAALVCSMLLAYSSESAPATQAQHVEQSTNDGQGTAGDSVYAFVNVTVVPMDAEGLLPNRTVVIRNGQIIAVEASELAEIPADARIIDGASRFLAPGLADMHTHPMTTQDLDLFLANGITLIRSMWGEPLILRMRDQIAAGELNGPRIITSGRVVDGNPVIHYGTDLVTDALSAEQVVSRQKQAGYDFIKVYSNLSLEAFDEIATSANSKGIPFAGHIPYAVPAAHAFRSNMKSFEHLTGVAQAISAQEHKLPPMWSPEFAEVAVSLGSGETTLDELIDEKKLNELAGLAAETGIWVVPTLVVLRGISLSQDSIHEEIVGERYRYMSYAVQEFWRLFPSMLKSKPHDYFVGMARFFEFDIKLVTAFHQAGARILAGTDALNPFVYSGFSLLDELELFIRAGMTPFEALQTATTNVGEFLGEVGTYGQVTLGARANLVLLDRNPLEDVTAYIGNLGVMADGDWLDKAELNARLKEVLAFNERDKAVFGDGDGDGWPLESGEQVVYKAAYRRFKNGEPWGAERISTVQTSAGKSVHISHTITKDGENQTQRIVPKTEPQFMGTAAGWLDLWPYISDMQNGETRSITGSRTIADESEPVEVTITRHPEEILIGHYYFTGCNLNEITINGPRGTTHARVWMGGGFYAGWPIKIELENDGQIVEYRRFL